MPFRFDRNWSGGGIIVYVQENIPSKQLTKHKLLDDVDGVFTEVNLRKTKWLIFSTYRPSSQPMEYFFKHISYALDRYRQTYQKFFLAGDFNTEETKPCLSEFLTCYDSKSLVKDNMLWKSWKPKMHRSFCHKEYWQFPKNKKSKLKEIFYRNYKKFDINIFKIVLRFKIQSIKSYESFEQVFLEVLNKHATVKKKFLRANQELYMTK